MKTECAIGIDIGGTKCAAGLVALSDGRVIEREIRPTQPERGGEAVLADTVGLAASMQAAALRIGILAKAIGIGLCELVSPAGEILSDATIQWRGMRVSERLEVQTALPVIVEADVRAAAQAEASFGAGRQFKSFLYVTVGTGVSASFVLEKRPYAGGLGLTGTFASSPELFAGGDGRLQSSLPLERFASGPALAARLTVVRPAFHGEAPDVVALADSGDLPAQEIVDSAGTALGAAIARLVNMLDPEAIVFGGGLGLVEGRFRKAACEAIRAHVWSELHRDLPVLSAALGNDAGLIGAALAAGREGERSAC
jgi:glucokinase